MDTNNKLFLCCFGEPKNHYCWGHIYRELSTRDRLLGAIDTYEYYQTPALSLLHRGTQRLSKLYYQRAHFDMKGSIQRAVRAQISSLRAKQSGATAVLHITTLDMPQIYRDRLRHYLLIDSTWHSWSRFANRDGYSDRLWEDIERLDRLSFEQSEHIFTLGTHVCDDLRTHYHVPADKCTAIGSGAGGIQPFFGMKDRRQFSILFVAKTRFESKGGKLLLDAYRHLSRRNPEISLTIVGGDDATEKITQQPNLKVLPYVSREDLQHLFNSSSLFVMPALNEPWGLVYLEAMSCQMPVVGLRRGSLPELTRNGELGFLIDQEDPIQLAQAIEEAFSDPSRLDTLGLRAQDYILSNYSWARSVNTLLNTIYTTN